MPLSQEEKDYFIKAIEDQDIKIIGKLHKAWLRLPEVNRRDALNDYMTTEFNVNFGDSVYPDISIATLLMREMACWNSRLIKEKAKGGGQEDNAPSIYEMCTTCMIMLDAEMRVELINKPARGGEMDGITALGLAILDGNVYAVKDILWLVQELPPELRLKVYECPSQGETPLFSLETNKDHELYELLKKEIEDAKKEMAPAQLVLDAQIDTHSDYWQKTVRRTQSASTLSLPS